MNPYFWSLRGAVQLASVEVIRESLYFVFFLLFFKRERRGKNMLLKYISVMREVMGRSMELWIEVTLTEVKVFLWFRERNRYQISLVIFSLKEFTTHTFNISFFE